MIKLSNNHNFNHFTGKKKACKQAKRKKHSKVQKGHKNKYERFCKTPKNNQSNLYWDTFSKEEKAQIATELYPFIAERLASDIEVANISLDFDNMSDDTF